MLEIVKRDDQKKILLDYLMGVPTQDIAEKYNMSARGVTSLVKNNHSTLLDIEKRQLLLLRARENVKMQEVRDESIELFRKALNEAKDEPEKHKWIQNFNGVFNSVDKAFRLNQDMATEKKETKTTHVDVAKVLAELKTPEQKKEFLFNQLKDDKHSDPQTEVIKREQ